MVKTGNFLLLLFFSFLTTIAAQAQVEVRATVDRQKMGPSDTFTLSIEVNSSDSVSISDPRLPDDGNFDLLNTWIQNQMSSSFVNGQFTTERKKVFNYLLAPRKQGTITIGPIEVVADGEAYKTDPINIEVSKSFKGKAQNRQRQQQRPQGSNPLADDMDDFEDLFSQLLRRRPSVPGFQTSPPSNPNEAFFIRLEVDKKKAYVGEQITASWYLYTRSTITEIDTLKYPSLNGFWKEDIELATRLNFSREVVDGISYQKALLASYALFPINPGKAVIDSYKAKCKVMMGNGFGRVYQFTKASPEVDVEILPLPKDTQPPDFLGAVGDFQVSAEMQRGALKTNEPFFLKIKFSGRGNAKLIELPSLELPPEFEVYDTKSESKFFKNGQSYKVFEVLMIPRAKGTYKIPEKTVSFFSPTQESYYGVKIPEQNIVISGEGADAPAVAGASDESGTEEKQQVNVFEPVYSSVWSLSGWAPVRGLSVQLFYLLCVLSLIFKWAYDVLTFGRKQSLAKQLSKKFLLLDHSLKQSDWRKTGVLLINCMTFVLESFDSNFAKEGIEATIQKLPPKLKSLYGEKLSVLYKKSEVLAFAPEEIVGDLKTDERKLKKLVADSKKCLSDMIKHLERE